MEEDDFWGAIDLRDDLDTTDPPAIVSTARLAEAIASGLGGGGSPVDPKRNTREFVEAYNLTIDQVPFDLGGRYKHLATLYEDEHPKQVLMAGAQTGKSARVMAGQARNLGVHYGSLHGYYFPDKHLPVAFSRDRFKPFLRSNEVLARQLGAIRKNSRGVDNTLTVTWGETTLYFLTTAGRSSTEGLPMKCVYFDELRRMAQGDVERAMERYSAQSDPIDWKVSTARLPNGDIDYWFRKTDQRYFHSACKCGDGRVLSTSFPDCVLDLRRATPLLKRKVEHAYHLARVPLYGASEEQRQEFPPATYWCPTCGELIIDPRDGWWEPHAQHYPHGYQMPQLLTHTYPAGRALYKYETNEDVSEVYNSMLGLAHVDPDKMPVQKDHVLACVDTELQWGERLTHEARRRIMVNCSMGVDVQKGYGCAVVKRLLPNGKHAVVHIEVVMDPDPTNPESSWWNRLGHLMHRYDVATAIVDAAPEFTAAEGFAMAFPGRVFLQDYTLGDTANNKVEWMDDTIQRDTKAKGEEIKVPWRVRMKRTHILHWEGQRWVRRLNCLPNPDELVQELPVENGEVFLSANLRRGSKIPTRIAIDPFIPHLCAFAYLNLAEEAAASDRKADLKVRQGKKQWVAEYVGRDPHFAHASAWASVGLTRFTRRLS